MHTASETRNELRPEVAAQRPAVLSGPLQHLMSDLLASAIKEAQATTRTAKATRHRSQARAWLRDDKLPLNVRTCCEAIGIDYEALMTALERQWASGRCVKMPHTQGRHRQQVTPRAAS